MLSWLFICTAAAAPMETTLKVPFHGMNYTSTVAVYQATMTEHTPEALMQANQHALTQVGQVVQQVTKRDALDDYGAFALSVAAVDALQIDVQPRRGPPSRAADDALQAGSWTQTERLFAVGAVLREQGYGAAMLTAGDAIYLGVPSQDDNLNADGLRHTTWTASTDSTSTFWMAWDGKGRLGTLSRTEFTLHFLPNMNKQGEVLSFEHRELPAWTLRHTVPYTLRLPDIEQEWTASNRPNAASYLRYFPSLEFEVQLRLARQELALLGLNDELRALGRTDLDEAARIDALLRGYQGSFVYEAGSLVSLFDMMGSGRGDCDQLSLLMAASLPELGYRPDQVKLIRWPGHVALGIQPQEEGPNGGTSVTLSDRRYYLLDLTYYQRRWDGSLQSRWGQIPEDRRGTVTVVSLKPEVERG